MKDTRRFLQYIGKYRFYYWLILIITLITESALQVLYSYVTKQTINAIEFQDMQMFRTAVIVCIIIVICKCLFPYLRYFHIHLVRRMVYELKLRLFAKLLDMNMKFYDDTHSAEAMRTLNMDADSLKTAWFSHVYWVSGKLVLVISSVVTMFFYSPILTFIALIISVLTAFVSIRINNSIKKHAKNVQNKSARLATLFSDIISGFVTLKMNSGASIVLKHFYKENGESAQAERSRVRMEASLEMAAFLLGIIGSFGTIIVGALLVADGKLNFGIVMAVVTLQMSMSSAMQRFGSSLAVFTTSVVRAGHVFDFLELEQEECVGWNTQTQVGTEDLHDKCDVVIEFYKLHFSYNENTQLYYEGLKVKNGEKIMLAGESGCGKSTFLKCVYRVMKPTDGAIIFDGRRLDELSYRESALKLAVVAQHNFYSFDFSVLDVVLMGRSPHKKILERDNLEDFKIARTALKTVGLEDFEERNFSTLSGGEQQRVILARALTQQTECLVLDEPTNHLDIKYQLQIMDIVKGLDLTVVAAIHDLNIAAMYCDRLVAIDAGTVVGMGTPQELLTEKFIYDMYGVESKINHEAETGRMNIVYLPQHWK